MRSREDGLQKPGCRVRRFAARGEKRANGERKGCGGFLMERLALGCTPVMLDA